MSNIETLGTRIARAMIKGDEAISKANYSTLEKVANEVVKAAQSGITKADLKPLRASIVNQYVEAGNEESSAKVQASQVMRLIKVAANLDKKLSEHHGIKTVDDGVQALENAALNSTSLKTCYEALGIPKADESAEGGEADTDTAEKETTEPTANEAPALRHLYSEFVQKAHDAGYTNDEIKEFITAL